MPKTESPGRAPTEKRTPIASLLRYMRDVSRAAGRGEGALAQERFARRCGTTAQYLWQIASGVRPAKPTMALRIEQGTYGLVRAEDLCPEFDWEYAKLRTALPKKPARARRSTSAAIEPATPTPEHDSTALAA